MYEYNAHVIRVVDGDTMHVMLDLGLDVQIHVTLRLAYVNTPEMHTPEGPIAKGVTEDWLVAQAPLGIAGANGIQVRIKTIKDKKEKYGRYLAIVYPIHDDGEYSSSLNAALVRQGWPMQAMKS